MCVRNPVICTDNVCSMNSERERDEVLCVLIVKERDLKGRFEWGVEIQESLCGSGL